VSKTRLAVFHPEFIDDLRCWVETDRKLALRALDLIEVVMRDPFTEIGKPVPRAAVCLPRMFQTRPE
jgi:toxin YoeB